MEYEEFIEYATCDWCDKQFDREQGQWIGSDFCCNDCVDYNNSIPL